MLLAGDGVMLPEAQPRHSGSQLQINIGKLLAKLRVSYQITA